VLQDGGVDPDAFPPEAVMMLMTSVSRVLVMEEALGMTTGHAEMRALVERCLTGVEGDPQPEYGRDEFRSVPSSEGYANRHQ
jgi:hypothetical protein